MKNLGAAWVLFVFLPALGLSLLVEHSLQWEEARIRDQGKLQLLREMKAFSAELEPPSFLEAVLKREMRNLWKACSSPEPREDPPTAQDLRRNLETRLGFKTLGIVVHGADLRKVTSALDDRWRDRLPPGMISRFLWAVNNFGKRRPAIPGRLPAWATSIGPDPSEDQLNRYFNLFSLAVGNAAETEFKPAILSATLSRWLGGGRLYWLYIPFFATPSHTAPVLGGMLVLLAERDLPPRLLLKRICRQPLHRTVRRDYRLLSAHMGTHFLRKPRRQILRFQDEDRGLTLVSRPGFWFLGFLAHRGTIHRIFPAERLLLTAHLPTRALAHPLRSAATGFNHLLVLGSFLGSAWFLYLHLFGFSLPLRLRGKILIGAIVAATLPMGLVLWGALMQNRIDQDRSRSLAESRLRVGSAFVEGALQRYMQDVNQGLLAQRDPLRELLVAPTTDTRRLRQLLSPFPINTVIGIDGRNRAILEQFRPQRNDFLERAQIEAISGVAGSLVLGIRQDKLQAKPALTIHGLPFMPTGLGDYLAFPGRFIPFRIGERASFLTALPVTPRPEAGGVASSGLLLMRAMPDEILRDFFHKNDTLMNHLQGSLGPWSITTLALPLDPATEHLVPGAYWKPQRSSWRGFPRFAEIAATLRQSFTLSCDDRSSRRVVSTARIPFFPCLIISWAEAPQAAPWSGIPIAVGCYLLLLAWFTVLLLDEVFRRPILEFVQVAEAIGKGEYPRLGLASGSDEFATLGASFETMIQGLRHRDALSQFVSDDVIETLESGREDALRPGGELAEVTVLFAGLRGFRSWATQATPAEAVQILNVFLETGSTVFRVSGGNLDKIIEETLMAVFRHRPGMADPAVRAVNAAFALQQALPTAFPDTAGAFPQRPVCDIGIASGKVLSGRIGSRHGTLDFSVIGNAVNLAARLKVQAKRAQRTGIIVAPSTIRDLRGRFRLEFIDRVEIKGLSREFSLYEVISARDESRDP